MLHHLHLFLLAFSSAAGATLEPLLEDVGEEPCVPSDQPPTYAFGCAVTQQVPLAYSIGTPATVRFDNYGNRIPVSPSCGVSTMVQQWQSDGSIWQSRFAQISVSVCNQPTHSSGPRRQPEWAHIYQNGGCGDITITCPNYPTGTRYKFNLGETFSIKNVCPNDRSNPQNKPYAGRYVDMYVTRVTTLEVVLEFRSYGDSGSIFPWATMPLKTTIYLGGAGYPSSVNEHFETKFTDVNFDA